MLPLFPVTAVQGDHQRISLAGHDLFELAQQYGTPLYVYDAATIRRQVDRLHTAMVAGYPGPISITYSAKAYLSPGFAKRLRSLPICLDVVSLGEMNIARAAGFRGDCIYFHGNNKSDEELKNAIDYHVAAIVVDSLEELDELDDMLAQMQRPARIWLRITPGLRVHTHAHVQTGHEASKFGIPISDGQAAQAIRRAQKSPWLNLVGLHTHIGSQLFEGDPFQQAVKMLVELSDREDYIPQEINPGGGWGVPYTEDDPQDDPEPWVQAVSATIQEEYGRRGWPLPRLFVEPGRWIVAQAGVAVYTVGVVKKSGDGTRFIAVDGGMADNPRPALYQAQYTARLIPKTPREQTGDLQPAAVVGKYCESGDELIPKVMLPEAWKGDLLVIPVSGAYQLSMSSNYNMAPRPAVLWLEKDRVEVLQPREKFEESNWWKEV